MQNKMAYIPKNIKEYNTIFMNGLKLNIYFIIQTTIPAISVDNIVLFIHVISNRFFK